MEYPLSVDYEMSVESAVRLGQYDKVDGEITTKNFPTERTGETDVMVELIHFNVVSSNDVLEKLDEMFYRPAELRELLAFGRKYPDVQREFPIVALGSVLRRWLRRSLVSCLLGSSSSRILCLDWYGVMNWGKLSRFAAVRKSGK